jgi:4-azaleucine resistance transporter AzlC
MSISGLSFRCWFIKDKGDQLISNSGNSRQPECGKQSGSFSEKQNSGKLALVGLIRAVPIILGYLPIGMAFGVLASTAGLSLYSAAAMSIFVFAGSAQLISVGLIASGATVASITITVFLVNLRHLLMSASLAPYLGKFKIWQQMLFSFELTDESFAVHSAYFRQNGTPPFTEIFALNFSAQLAWVCGTIIGAWIGGQFAFPIEKYGIDFALPAMFIALLVIQIEKKNHFFVALLAASLGLIFYLLGFSQLYIVLATIIAAVVGAATENNEVEKVVN